MLWKKSFVQVAEFGKLQILVKPWKKKDKGDEIYGKTSFGEFTNLKVVWSSKFFTMFPQWFNVFKNLNCETQFKGVKYYVTYNSTNDNIENFSINDKQVWSLKAKIVSLKNEK